MSNAEQLQEQAMVGKHEETDSAAGERMFGELKALRENLNSVIRGKEEQIEILIISLIAGGSVLLEDVPGVGKTTLAKALAVSLESDFKRIQFTPDLLPADILGCSVYNPVNGTFDFRAGPIFCNILLADEINRASPRTQSALLEAMSESQATIEGQRHPLPLPFMVLATENPIEFHGTYTLPEAQMDRFLVQLSLGYPDKETEIDILHSQAAEHPLDQLEPVLSREQAAQIQKKVRQVHVERKISQYIVEIVERTRNDGRLKLGASPRASLGLFRASQAAAMLGGREFVLPDDVQRLAPHVLSHRLILNSESRYSGTAKTDICVELMKQVKVPT
ncbi:MAG: MoxR family ATPase [Planctomycetota bacterium]|nr:MoxR family ATPase [Planctomycetota bacterium]MDA1137008.1 MoxR family ATPase [Planctomycetota bacterium]